MMSIREDRATQRLAKTQSLGLIQVLSTEDDLFAADLHAIWPNLPADWNHVETYYTSAFMGDRDTKMFQVWLCGATGELLIQLTQAGNEDPIFHFALTPATTGALHQPSPQDVNKVNAAIHALHLRHGAPGADIH